MGARAAVILLLLTGCATTWHDPERLAWEQVCLAAPEGLALGSSLTQTQLTALYGLKKFPTATEVNQRCR